MLSPSRSITPTLTSRKLTESSETLIPPLALHQDPPSIVFVWDPLYLLYLWALCWITLTIVQIYIYVQIWHIIQDIREVK